MIKTHTRETQLRWKMLTINYSGIAKKGRKQTIIPLICTGMLITHRTRVDEKILQALLEVLNSLKFQMLLVYMTEGLMFMVM
jgi:hypothetical protein